MEYIFDVSIIYLVIDTNVNIKSLSKVAFTDESLYRMYEGKLEKNDTLLSFSIRLYCHLILGTKTTRAV